MSGNLARAPDPAPLVFYFGAARPLLDRLGPEWMPEDEALEGLNRPQWRRFYACELGLAERRRRGWPWRRQWMIRLTKKGWAEA